MRRETAGLLPRPTATAVARPTMLDPWIGLVALLGVILALLGARMGFAEPADSLDRATPHVAAPPPASVIFSADSSDIAINTEIANVADISNEAADAPAPPEDAIAAGDVPPAAGEPARTTLEELLFVRRFGASSWKPQTTDEVLAAALANGSNPDLERPNPFRKRSRDLLRLERPVSIGDADMLLRLRLRAKASEAMSVELRF